MIEKFGAKKLSKFINLFFLWFPLFCYGIWGPDIRLTSNDSISLATCGNGKSLAIKNDTLHIVWTDTRNGNYEIYYKRSTDLGSSWSGDKRLTSNLAMSSFPSIVCAGARVHIVWQDNRDGNWEIYYKYSVNGGTTWSTDMRIIGDDCQCYPTIAGNSDSVIIVWSDNRNGNWDIYCLRSTNGGVAWAIKQLTTDSNCSWSPSVATRGGQFYVVWQDNRDGNFEIYYRRSTDAGATWGSEVRLTNTSTESYSPVIAVSGQNLHIAWREGNFTPDTIIADTTSDYNIYYMKSTDDGLTWGTPIKLNSNSRRYRSYPSLSVVGSMVNVVWEENWWFDGQYIHPCWTLHFVRSVNNGSTWSVDTCLVKNNNRYALSPTIGQYGLNSSSYLSFIVWDDNRNGNREIYFKKDSIYYEVIPPKAPYIPKVEKSGDDVKLTWNKVTEDTLGNPENVDYYVIYRNASPSFVPGPSDSIAGTTDTFYTDVGALYSSESYYYLVKAVDVAKNRSAKSNMGYKFNKFFNENPSATDKNWVSLPWHSEYATVSDLTTDLSPSGNPLTKVTNLRDDQAYESWIWDPDFLMWFGTDFAIQPGRGYEIVTIKDTTLCFVGSNNPAGLITLNENPSATDKNWVSIPYNAVYSTVSDITTEYSPSGNPLVKITNLRDDQAYESWIWDPDFLMWFGTDFAIQPGRGYEFVTIIDTVWNPTEYSNRTKELLARKEVEKQNLELYIGKLIEPEREPVWFSRSDKSKPQDSKQSVKPYDYELIRLSNDKSLSRCATSFYREVGISHIVRCHLDLEDFDITRLDNRHPVRFTVYHPDRPYDVLTENMIGCGTALKGERGALWFDVGNFKKPWSDKEEVILIIEALKQGRAYFAVVNFSLDSGVDIQELGKISLVPIPEPVPAQGSVCWNGIENPNVIGYSLYQGDKRLNERVITGNSYLAQGEVTLRPIIRGGYETVYSSGSQLIVGESEAGVGISYMFNVFPSLFAKHTQVDYGVPQRTKVEIVIYDVCGKRVKTLVSEEHAPGYYRLVWSGDDNFGRKVSAGIYFVQMNTKEYKFLQKVIFVH